MLLDIFKEVYDLPQNFEFKRLELENALIDKFGNLQYNKNEGWIHNFTGEVYSTQYSVELNSTYSIYPLYSYGTEYKAENVDEALMIFLIKYGKEPKQGTDEYYINYKTMFHEIVNKIYKANKISC